MKKLLTLSLLAMAVVSGSANAKDWKNIRVGIEAAYPPFNELTADKKIVGFDKDLSDAICSYLKANCTYVIQDWDGMIPGLLAQRFDTIISSMSSTEERKQKVSFTRPYYNTPAFFLVRKDSNMNVDSPAAMKGKRIGVQSATIFQNYADAFYKPAGATVTPYQTLDQVYMDLTSGRLDAVLFGSIEHDTFLKSKDGAGYKMAGKPLLDPKWFGEGAAIAVRKDDEDLRKQLDAAVEALHKNGTYDKIRKKYFSYDIWPKG
ncbi:transporter substrate-binding domain-containing protein [Leeia oryzae]|uniref:transporter substrate-binding domain-containing protein n=1 Tax=Leeia oryzae TaxID=356662 RepID=UPI0003A72F89|nr:transporter substrate-binding domain-containing protein [Leeia oryzae]